MCCYKFVQDNLVGSEIRFENIGEENAAMILTLHIIGMPSITIKGGKDVRYIAKRLYLTEKDDEFAFDLPDGQWSFSRH